MELISQELSPLPEPGDHIALSAMESALLSLQDEQKASPNRGRSFTITNLETAILWQKNIMGLFR